MPNENTPAEGTSSDQTVSESALRGAACSPILSATPETDTIVRTTMSDPKACPATLAAKLTIKCEQLERQRDGLVRIARDYIEDLDDSGDEAKAKDYRRWLNRILLENEPSPSVGTTE